MSLQDKYRSVLNLGQELDVQNGNVQEADGVLRIWGTAKTQYDKDRLWDEIKSVGGSNPSDLVADISVAITDYYTRHTVAKGESLSLIAKHYYKDPMKYKHIFEANRDVLKDPDVIHPGQELTIPNV
ncbi:MAG: LysM peptidoglycan-binding domain-containing protein [Saprospiraceae bacterium]|jgi:nucleoid-associated protein YgaU|nr:LysM peptidoglycan-binding domain-containing protein [Saprospiraceae bacterium]MBK7794864.1 LysM peptidoglycan-binding domain-containing protein [Saprospiraceae bacterium]MBK8153314.1 LysM peptidoglycan-binding domain-containing protein [Saprospiraceae bacterium]MBL0261305.1 LysM peptidoglycan-binding domain-containing protein [Saprospiraceae bacterium]MBX7164372.1 LysM peptidoglycan-binding domain-containing protein [Saprospiraceae bacterium]